MAAATKQSSQTGGRGAGRAGSIDTGLFIMRAMLAVVFVFHGAQKLFGWFGGGGLEGTAQFFESIGIPLPQASAAVVGAVEFLGGLILLVGTGARLAALVMSITMFVAAFTAHDGFAAQNEGMEYPLTLAFMLLGLALTGPGRYAVQVGVGKK